MSELGSLGMQEFEVFSVMLHRISHGSRWRGYGYGARRAEVLILLWCGEHGACRTPW
jgi:putative component of toxin-antitoxin plasmid stabilization module